MPGVTQVQSGLRESKRPPAGKSDGYARIMRIASAAILAVYFLYFAVDGLRARFAFDDLANMSYYFHRGTWRLILAQFEFCSTYLRPMGGLFYMPIFHLAGFNPLPYRVAVLLIIAANFVLFYVFAK